MSDVTIVVTTFNRYVFLARLLSYFRSTGSQYTMHILDSSSDTLDDPALQNMLEVPGITHTKFDSKISPMQKMYEGLQNVTTPYVAMWADDDFLVPQSIEAGKQLLKEREDLSIVHGQCASLIIGSDGVPRTGVYPQRAYLQETAAERLISYLSNYTVTFYSVHRTDALKRNATLTQAQGFGQFWAEVTLGCLAVIQGKAEKLDLLYLIKEAHGAQNTWEDHATEYDGFDRLTDTDFSSTYKAFRDCLAAELVLQDGISISAANEAVKQAFWSYLAQWLSNKWRSRYAPGSGMPPSPRQTLRRIPGLRQAWGKARGFLPGAANQMTLSALLRPTSPYYQDFKLIYQALATPVTP